MGDTQIIATVVAAVAGPQGLLLLAGYVANHPENVRRSWQDGRAWLVARAADTRTAREVVRRYMTAIRRGAGRALRAAALAVLGAVLRAHGRHRMGARMSHLTASLIVLGWLALQVPIGTGLGRRLRQNQPQGGHQMNTQMSPARGVLPPEQCPCGALRTAGHQCGGAR